MPELIAILLGSIFLLIFINLAQKRTSPIDRQYYQRKWQEIRTLERTSAAARRLAVIEADKTLDRALKELGFKGSTMSDRLKAAGQTLGNPDNVWFAHKLRNRLVHEETRPKVKDIRRAINAYQSALKKLGAL